MKKIILSLKAIALCVLLCAQAPHTFNYQAVVRGTSGQVVADSKVAVRFTIHDGAANGPVVFTELQNATTNQFGLVTVSLGANAKDLESVNWAVGEKYLQVEMDITNKGTFADMGTSQLLSVPYAFYAGKAGSLATNNEKTLSDDNVSWNCKTHTLTIDNQSVNVTNCDGTFGATGPTGPAGAAGAKGATGATGPAGVAGATGNQGTAGVAGAKGATGSTGAQGPAGVAGPQGVAGPAGAQGVAGPAGAQGAQGVPGSTGPQGIQGALGPQGIAGPQGAQGAQGIPGVTGPQGIQGNAGTNGTNGVNGAPGVTGANGPTGPQGPAGNNGTNGAVGATGPAGVTGANGATGPTGNNGTNGTPGATGQQGPAGNNGTNGAPGVTGANGATGPQGPTGAQGPAGNNGVGVTGPTGPAGSGSSLPNGSAAGQILMWDGTQWVATTLCSIFGSDVNNCGACGHVCSLPNATPTCNNGQCAILSCNPGFADCNGIASDGCEVNLNGDAANCGACGTVCSFPNAVAACTGGGCVINNCNAGFADCNSITSDGCEINTITDILNCGTCGTVCTFGPNSFARCAGYCQLICFEGFQNCDGNPANGCEVNIATDANNCGNCGAVCHLPNATAGCSAGGCIVVACNPGFADCNRIAADGCEVNLNDPNNCGTCGRQCFVANGTSGCNAGSCIIASCNAGFADCNNNVNDGCEINVNNNVLNCGGCGRQCFVSNGTPGCTGSNCTIASCNQGFADCDAFAGDGCEVNVNSSVSNCGGCGRVCFVSNGNAACTGGSCTIANCNSGFANCNNIASDGCEINVNTDAHNCGSCGNQCPTLQSCVAGACH